MATAWQISRRTGACAVTGRPFEDGERHVSFLREREGALERVDLSLDAWRDRGADEDDGEPLLFWHTRHDVEPRKTVQLDLDALGRLFVALEGHESVAVREFRYVLCLLLMRKRKAKVEKVDRKGGVESFIVKRPRDDTRYRVFVYDFEPERLDELRAQMQAVFDGAEGPDGIRLEGDDEDGDPSLDGGPQADGGESAPDADADSPEREA